MARSMRSGSAPTASLRHKATALPANATDAAETDHVAETRRVLRRHGAIDAVLARQRRAAACPVFPAWFQRDLRGHRFRYSFL